jgi:hypothetical protein
MNCASLASNVAIGEWPFQECPETDSLCVVRMRSEAASVNERDGAVAPAFDCILLRCFEQLARAWGSPIAGVSPSPLSVRGHSTPLTVLWLTAFFSHRYSNREASAASRWRIVAAPPRSKDAACAIIPKLKRSGCGCARLYITPEYAEALQDFWRTGGDERENFSRWTLDLRNPFE